MKKITLLITSLLYMTFGYSQNLITNGTFDDATGWTVVNQYGTDSTNGSVDFSNGVVNVGKIDDTDGGWIHMGFYTSLTLTSGWYQFDMDMNFDGINEIWGEVYLGTEEPVQNQEYFGDMQVIKAYNAWDCLQTYSGSAVASGCDDSNPGLFFVPNDGTYYLLFRSGGSNFGTSGVELDNFNLTASSAPAGMTSDFYFDFASPAGLQTYNISINEDATNTVTDGINPSTEVAEISGINDDWFSKVFFQNPVGIDLSSADKGVSLKVKGPRALPVTVKIENGGTAYEVTVDYTTPNVWQELIFDFTGANSVANTEVAVFFDIQVDSDVVTDPNLNTFQIDDFMLGEFATLGTSSFENIDLTVYPNPTTDFWNISTNNQIISFVEVFDMNGKRVAVKQPQSLSSKIDSSGLGSGTYILKITTDKSSTTQKIVKL
ncbi:T9SS type A sorting domain-containing protein [Mesohalobacter halotolerans]|uniref:T9SS type A sorting domain-containing protein n=1 Tax=Mesohalobacter halotolerans TaxID=1883405 RepID=A0A4U5TNY7_9FLAO|nr:T9SS type A sorting domain-containing protein [Mesohalobacter halotolerans]TKS55767.1 T9SS type A sorting domain-containing protein [Mesohalobacter halotolerans]